MPRNIPLVRLRFAAALALVSLAAAPLAFAQSSAPAQPKRMSLDSNNDGFIDRNEAAKMPRLAERFDQLDRNRDGRLDRSELPRHQGEGNGKGKGKRGGHGGLEKLDADKDGRISRAELQQAAAADTATATASGKTWNPASRLLQNFAAIDSNRDGYLVRSELAAWHERMRPQREAERSARFNAMFDAADLNRDGRLSRVEVTEKMPRLAERFDWLDDNKDGFLSREELRGKHARR
ncbi:MAG: EF-hand domain-containing protein [Pseudomonadota bacterium]|nr:EF-hand domain-containing protein [Pseudomonadota bacterium]